MVNTINEPRQIHEIGTKFIHNKKEYTIVDIYTTRNSSGDIVSVSYVADYPILGSRWYDIPGATISRALLNI